MSDVITTRWVSQPTSYQQVWTAMRDFTEARDPTTPDQIWLVEHAPVYTLGQAGKAEHILNSAGIPVVPCDRGGQVTYHGPGQVTAYCLINLRRYHLFVKEYVVLLERVLVDFLHDLGLTQACTRPGAPGVYVPQQSITSQHTDVCSGRALIQGQDADDAIHLDRDADIFCDTNTDVDPFQGLAKIAALGIKVRNGCTYHGLALNVDMDLTPFSGINPCGYQGMPTTDLRSCGVSLSVHEAGDLLAERLAAAFIDYGRRKAQETPHHDVTNSAAAH